MRTSWPAVLSSIWALACWEQARTISCQDRGFELGVCSMLATVPGGPGSATMHRVSGNTGQPVLSETTYTFTLKMLVAGSGLLRPLPVYGASQCYFGILFGAVHSKARNPADVTCGLGFCGRSGTRSLRPHRLRLCHRRQDRMTDRWGLANVG